MILSSKCYVLDIMTLYLKVDRPRNEICFLIQGQGLYTGMHVNKFYPLVYGQDIASIDADEDSAGYDNL